MEEIRRVVREELATFDTAYRDRVDRLAEDVRQGVARLSILENKQTATEGITGRMGSDISSILAEIKGLSKAHDNIMGGLRMCIILIPIASAILAWLFNYFSHKVPMPGMIFPLTVATLWPLF